MHPTIKIRVTRVIRAKEMKHQNITSRIIECAYKVHNTLGFGFLESVYKKGTVIELAESTLRVEVKRKYRKNIRQDQQD